jgi:serine/threonine protein kinase
VVHEVCRALGHVHALRDEEGRPLRLVHRDLHMSNIHLGADGVVRLLDFGIAKALADPSARTKTGLLRGTVGFVAPEQVAGLPFDHRADVFAAGAVLHQTLTGRPLFCSLSEVERATIPPPSLHNRAVPPELDRVCLRALARDPAQRFEAAEEMAEQLGALARRLRFGPRELAATLRPLLSERRPAQRYQALRTATRSLIRSAQASSPRTLLPLAAVCAVVAALVLFVSREPRRPPPSGVEAPIAGDTVERPAIPETPDMRSDAIPPSPTAPPVTPPRRKKAAPPPRHPHDLRDLQLRDPFR